MVKWTKLLNQSESRNFEAIQLTEWPLRRKKVWINIDPVLKGFDKQVFNIIM